MTAALCIVFGFVVGVFSGGMVLMIAGNKLITKQLVAEQTKLNAELVRTKERVAAERRKRLQFPQDRSEGVIGYPDTFRHV
jgi:hypothetical protein